MLKRFLAQLVPVFGLLAVFTVLVVVAWRLLISRPMPKEEVKTAPPEPPFVTVAGAAVELEIFAPDGRHTPSESGRDTTAKVPESEGKVECDNFGDPKATEANCTASVIVRHPASGEYRVLVTSGDKRSETLNVGWGGEGFRRSGGFDVPVTVDASKPANFTIIVSTEGVLLRTERRP